MIVALAGSGEFLPAMAAVDRELLAMLPGRRVAILPTAAGLEDPDSWGRMGVEHFRRLGAEAAHVRLHVPADAANPAILAELATADLFYLSGGTPDHLIDTLAGSRAWEVILSRLAAGAGIAGCSAGATALGGHAVAITTTPWGWCGGLSLLPACAVLPHFDAPPSRPTGRDELMASLPPVEHVLGIDEDTVLVWTGSAWRVRGRGRVVLVEQGLSLFAGGGVQLPAPLAVGSVLA